MKRAIFGKVMVTVLACAAGAACSPPVSPEAEKGARAETAAGWTRPPIIRSFRRDSEGLIFSGQAEVGARVVLRSESGPAHAAVADARGDFEIRMTPPAGDLLLSPEVQVGQDAVASPDRLLIVAGGRGPVAILRPGGATRRLDDGPALGAVDSDGRMRLVSGRGAPSGPPIELQAGGEAGQVVPDAEGRWSLVLPPSAGADEIRVNGQTFLWPGDSAGTAPFAVERAGEGWRVIWSGPAGGRQTTWLPDPQ